MSRSRFGGFFFGKRLFSRWNELKSSSAPSTAPTNVQDFAYTDAQGIWKMRSTTQFPKSNAAGRGSSEGEGGGGGGGSPSYSLGLTSSLRRDTTQSSSWQERTIDISAYAGATVRPVFHYVSGTNFRGDLQIDSVSLDGSTYSFESSGDSFQTNRSNEGTYTSVSWFDVADGTTAGRWNRDSGGTPSGNTGLAAAANGSFYLYTEVTGSTGFPNINFWLRGPQVTLSSSPTFTYYDARVGTNIGEINIHLDVIS